jgi:LysM domain.
LAAKDPSILGDGMKSPEEMENTRSKMSTNMSIDSPPAPNYSPGANERSWAQVQKGDTLSSLIAQAYGIDPSNAKTQPNLLRLIGGIAKANGIANPDSIQPGQIINFDAYDPSGSYSPRPKAGSGLADMIVNDVSGSSSSPLLVPDDAAPHTRWRPDMLKRIPLDMSKLPRM